MNEKASTIQSGPGPSPWAEGSTVLVTGAARRLGAAMAHGFAAAGCDVIVHCNHSLDEARQTRDAIEKTGRRSWVLQGDLADEAALEGLIDRANELAGTGRPVNILVNNASIFNADSLLETTPAALRTNVAIHATAALVLARAMAAALETLAPERPGRVITMLDSRMHDVDPQHAAYHLSKRMALDLTRLLALELAPAVTVNAIAPGLILPPPGEGPEYLEELKHTNPLNRYGSAEEIVAAAMYLASAPFVTGQVLYVDGGRHLKGAVHH